MTVNSTAVTTHPATEPDGAAAGRKNLRAVLAPIARTVALPLGAYFVLHALGYSDFAGLLAGTVLSGLMLGVEAVRSRRLDAFSALMLGVFVFGLIASLISGDPRLMIVKDSVGTMIVGAAFLISIAIGKPLTYVMTHKAMSATSPGRAAAFATTYRNDASARRVVRGLSAMWGCGLLGEAVVRVVLAYQLPVHTMVWLSTVLMLAVVVPMVAVNIYFARRGRRAIG
ncbi:VC0807 family protein [Nocardia callitridis]|uniref:DUF3159 domain-containing protein n=1 Tax=Nocardia callitridis TaxID=648753 RepID=A0ABP9L574_9NOCA